jgi:hypothetical protein
MDLCPCVRNTYRVDVFEHVFHEQNGLVSVCEKHIHVFYEQYGL